MQLALVKWVDSTALGGWHHADDDIVPVNCESVGWVMQDDKDIIVLVQTTGQPGDQICNIMSIPKAAIKSVQHLTRRK